MRYFLYEYELELLSNSRQKKVDWDDLRKTPKDKISIEHIYPQTETDEWQQAFEHFSKEERKAYSNSLGNLLLLSSAINSSLQNDSFAEKKRAKIGSDGSKLRSGYADGSHSEIEVSLRENWGPDEIRERGMSLIRFLETHWDIRLGDDPEREKLLFLGRVAGEESDVENSA